MVKTPNIWCLTGELKRAGALEHYFLFPLFLLPIFSIVISHPLCLLYLSHPSLPLSQGHIQSEALGPIRQLQRCALVLSFSFSVCVCLKSFKCMYPCQLTSTHSQREIECLNLQLSYFYALRVCILWLISWGSSCIFNALYVLIYIVFCLCMEMPSPHQHMYCEIIQHLSEF